MFSKRLLFHCLVLSLVFLISVPPSIAQERKSFQNGLQAYFQNDYETARKHFQKAVSNDSDLAKAQFFLGNTYNRLGDTNAAVEQYRQTLSIRKGHKSARKKLADIFFRNKNWNEAVDLYKYLAERNPESFLFHQRLGVAHFKQQNLDKAKKNFLRARRLKNEAPEAHFYLGRVLMNRNEYLNAASRFNRAIELNPSEGKYYFYRGLSYFREEDYRSREEGNWNSADDFQKAIDEGFNSPKTRFMYANSLLNRGLYYRNNDRANEAIKLFKRSIRQYRQVLSFDWQASNAFHNMGIAYLGIGKLDLAKKSVEKAILSEPSTSFFHDTLAEIYYRMGKFGKAIESWNFAQELDSDYSNHPFEPMLFDRSIPDRIQEAKLRR